jgi:hypothetical protein
MTIANQQAYCQPQLAEGLPEELGALRWDVLEVPKNARLALTVLECDETIEQAVVLSVNVGRGLVRAPEHGGKAIHVWCNGQCEPILVEVNAPAGLLTIDHAWKEPARGHNPVSIWREGPFAGMLREMRDGARIYRCNNGRPGEGFDKLVFSLELL